MASRNEKVTNKPLSKKRQEEEEQINEIKSNLEGFYYNGMSVEEMKLALKTLKKSEEKSPQNVENSSISTTANESKSVPSSLLSLESDQNRSKPSYSYTNCGANSLISTGSVLTENEFSNREKRPDPALNKSHGPNINNEHSHNNESIYSKNSNVMKDDYPQLRNKSNYSLRQREISKSNARDQKKKNLERWKLNPLKSTEDGDDVPLKQPERLCIFQEEYFPYSNEELDDETFDTLCRQMSEKLDYLHDNYPTHITINKSKTIWGSPIKVSSKWNSRPDKSSVTETIPAPCSNTADTSSRDPFERSSKRKALHIIAADTSNYSSDENSDDELVTKKKRQKMLKYQQAKKAEEMPKKVQENHENRNNKSPVEMIEVNEIDDLSDLGFNNSYKQSTLSKRAKVTTNSDSIENELAYPRRVPPPNPGRKSCKGPRCKKKNVTQLQNSSAKNTDSLNDSEISKKLEKFDEMDDIDCIDITDEIKPALISKGTQKKLNMAHSHLENKKRAKEQKIKDEEEVRKQKAIAEQLQKDELISKRLQESDEETKRKSDKERKLNNQESFYKNIVTSRKQFTKAKLNTIEKQNYDGMSEDALLADDEDDETNCPICQRHFPADQIETHASECNQFPSESSSIHCFQASTSYSNRDFYDCAICNKYTTYDGKKYEEHVTKCKENAEDQRRNGIFV